MYTNLITVRDIASRWIVALYEIGEYFFNSSVGEFIHTLSDMLDKFPFLELLNILIKPMYWLLNLFGVGQLTLFEFTLGFSIGIIVTVALVKWLMTAIPIL